MLTRFTIHLLSASMIDTGHISRGEPGQRQSLPSIAQSKRTIKRTWRRSLLLASERRSIALTPDSEIFAELPTLLTPGPQVFIGIVLGIKAGRHPKSQYTSHAVRKHVCIPPRGVTVCLARLHMAVCKCAACELSTDEKA